MTATLGNALEYWAKDAPDRVAICFAGQPITYRELNDWSVRVAAELSRRGVEPGHRVGIFAGNSASWCAAAMGIVKAGAVLAPLNYRYTATELRSVVADCSPTLLIADAGRRDRVQELIAGGQDVVDMAAVSALRDGPPANFRRDVDPGARAVIAYTSGSTAQPKGVVFTHRTMLAYAYENQLVDSTYRPGARSMAVAPFYTGAGTITFFQGMTTGLTVFYEPEFNAEKALRNLIEHKVEIFGAVPTFFERIAAAPGFETADLSHVTHAVTGGARVSRALLQTWLARGVVLRQIYGLTEGGGNTTIMDPKGAVEFPEKCGRGGPFTRHRIVDETGADCAPDTPGEILVRGPGMMLEYWNNPEATAAAFTPDGWLRTGDLGLMDAEGRIQMVDRLKDLIISGGLNISPIDVENVVAQVPGVVEVAVIPAHDERFGETPLAVVHACGAVDVAALIAHCGQHLADYKVPRYVAFEDEPLPRLATGKISKRALKEKYRNAAAELPRVR